MAAFPDTECMPMDNRSPSSPDAVRVWDPFVRVFHWSLVAAFGAAYLSEGESFPLHAWAGYAVGGLVLLRVLWGFVGSEHARFSSFVRGPSASLRYVGGLLRLKSPRYLGHSPGGGAMVVVLLLSLLATVGSGLVVYGGEKHAGPLASLFAAPAAGQTDGDQEREEEDPVVEAAEEAHEILANFTLLLVVLHLGGVMLASFAHRENLVRAMVTGNKRR